METPLNNYGRRDTDTPSSGDSSFSSARPSASEDSKPEARKVDSADSSTTKPKRGRKSVKSEPDYGVNKERHYEVTESNLRYLESAGVMEPFAYSGATFCIAVALESIFNFLTSPPEEANATLNFIGLIMILLAIVFFFLGRSESKQRKTEVQKIRESHVFDTDEEESGVGR